MDRSQMIARKEQIRRELMLTRRQIDKLNMGQSGEVFKRRKKQVRQLEGKLERLMAEESELRIKIDQAPPAEAPQP